MDHWSSVKRQCLLLASRYSGDRADLGLERIRVAEAKVGVLYQAHNLASFPDASVSFDVQLLRYNTQASEGER